MAAVVAAAAVPRASRAESWCADPLWVHEWGVEVFASGTARRALDPALLPAYFHDRAAGASAAGPPVRGLPVDGGERDLPLLQFYSAGGFSPAQVAVEVGFANGDASSWYPQVDVRRTAADANGAPARAARGRLLQARAARTAARARLAGGAPLLPGDPTRQLEWDDLSLTATPAHARAASTVAWVSRLRGFDDALWVNGATESERFVYYEARTTETPALRFERGPTYAGGHRHLLIRNASRNVVFDVFLVHREGTSTFLFYAPSIPGGATAGLVLEDHRTTPASFAAGSRAALRRQLVDAHQPAPPHENSWDPCVMMRDPALPVETSEGHRLYAREADALLEVWGARFFDAPGTTLVYREDTHTLDTVMPLSIYTDMYHFVLLRRTGLALIEGAALP